MSYEFSTPIYKVDILGDEFDKPQQECVASLLQGMTGSGIVSKETLEDLIRTAFVDGLTQGLASDMRLIEHRVCSGL